MDETSNEKIRNSLERILSGFVRRALDMEKMPCEVSSCGRASKRRDYTPKETEELRIDADEIREELLGIRVVSRYYALIRNGMDCTRTGRHRIRIL